MIPLNQTARFKVQLQNGNRFQVPTKVRWRYKLEPSQTLNVTIDAWGRFGVHESFLAMMRKDGRITVPALVVALIKQAVPDLKSVAMEVVLNPG